MLVGIAGRKASGKTTVAEVVIRRGYRRASFAAGLKEYVGGLYNWSEAELSSQDTKEEVLSDPVAWDSDACKRLSDMVGIDLQFEAARPLHSRREAMQFIGTDVLRAHDPDFHIREFKKRFTDGDFVCDDIRFGNELTVLRDLNAVSAFVLRPSQWEYSNHASEVSVRRKDLPYALVNWASVKDIQEHFERIISGGTLQSPTCNWQDAFYDPTPEAAFWAGVLSASRHVYMGSELQFAHPDRNLVRAFGDYIREPDELIGSGLSSVRTSCPYIVDDLKMWDLSPKSRPTEPPKFIGHDREAISAWFNGRSHG